MIDWGLEHILDQETDRALWARHVRMWATLGSLRSWLGSQRSQLPKKRVGTHLSKSHEEDAEAQWQPVPPGLSQQQG